MDCADFLNLCCCLDVECNEKGEIYAVGAVFNNKTFQRHAPFNIHKVLSDLAAFAGGATYLLGHNLLRHDLPICRAISPQLDFFNKPAVDTLYLSPLAFPENPYHRLVKNYKLVRDSLNDPVADARLAQSLFQDQYISLAMQHKNGGLLSFYHYAFSGHPQYDGLQQSLLAIGAKPLDPANAVKIFKSLSSDKACQTALAGVLSNYLIDSDLRPALAYSLAWLLVAGGNSVLPPWVRQQFVDLAPVLSQLRDIPCHQPDCSYCQHVHNPVQQLQRYFGFAAFRPQPATAEGASLQQNIVAAAMRDQPLFAILPTGGGKSLCFQLPALVRYQRRGVLTIVISPLQALMKDQVDNIRNKTGSPNAAALYGMLTSPERGDVLHGIQMGDIALLYVSPEQLRNRSFQQAIAYREIGCWVFDEAHCLSKWGHDFRPDYLYAARFIKEFAQQQNAPLPPVQCFTATAKQDVKDEIIDYFRANLGQDLLIFAGGVERVNLQFEVQMVNKADKFPSINKLLQDRLAPDQNAGSAIIYCSTRKGTEETAEYLVHQGWQVEAFHAGKNAAEKKHIQENFITGSTRIITATNAFGMGIDKDDVRLVIHADIPGSLENYLQEAGRAGRDQQQAECILLYDEQDIETQFKLSAAAQINQRDIAQILRGLRHYKKDPHGDVVLTSAELLQDDSVDTTFNNEDYNAGTKVVTAISWLERAGYLQRNENRTQVFQGRPLVKNLQEAKLKLTKLQLSQRQQQRWLAILEALFNADSDEGFSADELALLSSFADDSSVQPERPDETASQRVIRTLYDMAQAGLIQKSMLLTAYVRYKVANASSTMLEKICALERAMIQALQEQAPDADNETWQSLSLRRLNQSLLDSGHITSNPELLRLLISSLAKDGLGLAGNRGSINIRHRGQDHYAVKLNRDWQALTITAERRQGIAKIVLDTILQRIPDDTIPAADLLIEFSAEDLLDAIGKDLIACAQIKDPLAAVERALNFLHELRIITLQKGIAVFRQAMTIHILPEAKGRRYSKGDYEPLSQHYNERVFQVHVINEYARKAIQKIGQALAFVFAYFAEDKTEFVKHFFSDQQEIFERATSQQSFQRIVGDLHNPQQTALVAGHENDNSLILAGPGSGKTRVVVHRCAYLLRVKRVPADSILVLCFNRNAVTELRQRLLALVGKDVVGVTIQTYHGLSMRLTGHAITSQNIELDFSSIMQEAISLLRGEKQLLGMDDDVIRERLLAGYQFILVDEYQDIDQEQYQLVAALAGLNLDVDKKLTIMAVGDDDQNIYQFRGANIEFIRRFKQDYKAQVHYLVENYRSSANIIAAANQLIAHNKDRMKTAHPIRINQGRQTMEAGGRWQKLDPLARGRVQIISVANEQGQAAAIVAELIRLRQLDTRLDWTQCAIVVKEWRLLSAVRAMLDAQQIPVSLLLPADRQPPPFRIRENAALIAAIKQHPEPLSDASYWLQYIAEQSQKNPHNPWWEQLRSLLQDLQRESGDGQVPAWQILDYLYESLQEQRRERRLSKGILLSTIHSVKGMEFAHVFIVDGGWKTTALEEQRRLFYVAMTRCKETLCLLHRRDASNPFLKEMQGGFLLHRDVHLPGNPPQTTQHYAILGLQDLDIGYAGSFPAMHPIHQHLAKLNPGCSLTLVNHKGKIFLKDKEINVAVLSKNAALKWQHSLTNIQSVSVIAMITRYRDDSEEQYRSRYKVEQWEVPMLELVYTQ
jgi:ATP-dependent DNA helicase RecQ